jgi:hypothetical protein
MARGLGLLLAAGASLPYAFLSFAAADNRSAKVDFGADILPLLKARCASCHAGTGAAAGLDLSTAAGIQKGGSSGKLVLGGNSKGSLLIHRLAGQDGKPRMPMGFAPLGDEEMAKMRAWIDGGASVASANGRHWAYVKPVRPALPAVKNKVWIRNPIDAFVLARLEKEGLKPSEQASKETLLRRVSLDLTGLPPTVEEADAFLADTSPNAYEKVVDRLLASPQYGERQARPWLDLARYADTNGYEADRRRSMWPYRDWVVKAFNRNIPFDQFTIEQIAGDLLPNATVDQLVATGFNRNTMHNEEGGVDRAEQRWLTLIDRVATTSQTWLGSTVACAQCHDHKYDPFKQKDFYRFLAYFETAQEPAYELPSPELDAERQALRKQIADLEAAKAEKKKIDELKNRLNGLRGPSTLIMREPKGAGAPWTYVRLKGSFLAKGEPLYAATPGFLGAAEKDLPQSRLGLAKWLVSKDNPLTARVTVNRMWEQYFGRGLVETTEDLGTQGSKPTHPKLLDWLATEFMRRAWDMKALHRLIVTSATYRQSSAVSPKLLERDPSNELLTRGPRFRLEAEMIRDAALRASGLLSLKMGGPSVYPPQPDGIWDSPYSDERWQPSQGEDRYRRSIYTFWKRTAPYPAFVLLDAASREACTVRRIRTNTPLQALALLNDPGMLDAAKALAKRMTAAPTSREGIVYAFRSCVTRRPTEAETNRLIALYQRLNDRYTKDPESAKKLGGDPSSAAFTMVANVILNLDENLTKG